MSAPLVIVGTGLAGYNLAREWRKLDSTTPLLLITSDDGRSYSKPMLSTGFGKQKDADGLTMAQAGAMAAGNRAQGQVLHPVAVAAALGRGGTLLLQGPPAWQEKGFQQRHALLLVLRGQHLGIELAPVIARQNVFDGHITVQQGAQVQPGQGMQGLGLQGNHETADAGLGAEMRRPAARTAEQGAVFDGPQLALCLDLPAAALQRPAQAAQGAGREMTVALGLAERGRHTGGVSPQAGPHAAGRARLGTSKRARASGWRSVGMAEV